MNQLIVSASLLSADPLRLGEELDSAEMSDVDWHHVDVMDGHFVPNLSFGLPLIQALKAKTKKPLDVHIMVSNPDDVAIKYCEAGSSYLTFHHEASSDPMKLIQKIKATGTKIGMALKPGTDISVLSPFLADLDLINVMSVEPGFSGQSFQPAAKERVRTLSEHIRKIGSPALIQVDGGVTQVLASELYAAGARVMVVGHYFYRAGDRKKAVGDLHAIAKKAET